MEPEFVHPAIEEAIREGVKAGVFRRAGRLNPDAAELWSRLAEAHHMRASFALGLFLGELDA